MLINERLLALATVGSLVILVLLIFFPIATGNEQIFMALGGLVAGYFFGSSHKKEPPP